jgi:diguanylate cyclase (GGDEF)-like protein
MASFLIIIDRSGKTMEIIWSEPVFNISRHYPLFSDSFVLEDRNDLRLMIDECIQGDSLLQCTNAYRLISNGIKMRICLLPMADNVLVFAWDEQNFKNTQFVLNVQSIIHKFMNAIKNHLESNLFHNTKSISLQFEKIQKLNNDLINTERMLEKANGQLALLNRELNNRLVKDALTGLVSRYQYHAEIDMLIADAPDKLGIFTFIDIDDFKAVNDTYGHTIGDHYLIDFSDRLKKLPFKKSIKMRISGDEFGIFQFGLVDVNPDQFDEIWEEICSSVLFAPINTTAGKIPISISAGMAVYGIDTNDIYELIEYADYAMYIAKKKGKSGFHVFDKSEYEGINGVRP